MPRPINPIYPIAEVSSIDDLMDIALGLEHEAAERYAQLAAEMERRHETALAGLFEELADLERDHENGLARWAEREGRRPPRPATFRWRMPETFGEEAAGAEAHVLTPYRALSLAVRNEERAFAFYTYLAAIAETDEVRERAEALAREELEHVALLRARRRQAFHAERGASRRREAVPRSMGEMRDMAWGLENASAEIDAAAAEALDGEGHAAGAAVMRKAAEDGRARVGRLAREGASPSAAGGASAEAALAAGLIGPGALTAFGALRLSLRNAEEVLETYLRIADQAADEDVLGEAQRLGEGALARLALIRSQFAAVED